MKGIKFGSIHSYNDLSLILSKPPKIGSPPVKKKSIDIPGASGELDFTEWFGAVHYGNRALTFDFVTKVPRSEFYSLFSRVQNMLHGKKLRIVLDDDSQFYYLGRLSVSDFQADIVTGKIVVTADCEPYKYKLAPTAVKTTVSGSKTVTYTNLSKRVSPKISTTGSVNITFKGGSYSLAAGADVVIPNIVFEEGENVLTFTGTSTVTVTYQEGEL